MTKLVQFTNQYSTSKRFKILVTSKILKTTDSGIDLVDDTYIKLGIAVEGTGSVKFYINDQLVATHTTNIPDDENLTIAAMSVSGSATGTRATVLDYMMASQTR